MQNEKNISYKEFRKIMEGAKAALVNDAYLGIITIEPDTIIIKSEIDAGSYSVIQIDELTTISKSKGKIIIKTEKYTDTITPLVPMNI